MAGNICEYHNCSNSRRKIEGIRMYRFPHRNAKRCKIWIINSGATHLEDMPLKELQRKFICEQHFRLCDYVNVRKQRLNSHAAPKHFMEVHFEGKVYPAKNETRKTRTKSFSDLLESCNLKDTPKEEVQYKEPAEPAFHPLRSKTSYSRKRIKKREPDETSTNDRQDDASPASDADRTSLETATSKIPRLEVTIKQEDPDSNYIGESNSSSSNAGENSGDTSEINEIKTVLSAVKQEIEVEEIITEQNVEPPPEAEQSIANEVNENETVLPSMKEEIEVEEFVMTERKESLPAPEHPVADGNSNTEEFSLQAQLIPKPIKHLLSPISRIVQLPDLVFTFESRHHQPSQTELTAWLTRSMLKNRSLLQSIGMVKMMNGCFIIRLKSHSIQYFNRELAFNKIWLCFNDIKDKQTNSWKVERFDIVPGKVWVRVSNMPPMALEAAIIKALAQYGQVLKVTRNNLVPQLEEYQIGDGDKYVNMRITRTLPTELVISGYVVWLSYCAAPDI